MNLPGYSSCARAFESPSARGLPLIAKNNFKMPFGADTTNAPRKTESPLLNYLTRNSFHDSYALVHNFLSRSMIHLTISGSVVSYITFSYHKFLLSCFL